MSTIQSVNQNQSVVMPADAWQANDTRRIETATPLSDISGATTSLVPIRDQTLPPIASNRTDLQNALATLQGKSSQIQEALGMVAALYAPKVEGKPVIPSSTVNGMITELFQAATTGGSSAALHVFCRELNDMIAQVRSQCPGQTVDNVCSTARELIDLLSDPESARKNAALIEQRLNSLNGAADSANDSDPAATLVRGLKIVFGAALSALDLSNRIQDLVEEGLRTGTIVLTNTPHAAEVSGLVTVMAMLTLLNLISSQISEELDARLSLSEEQEKLRRQQMELLDRQAETRERVTSDESIVDQAESSSAFNAVLSKSFGEGLSEGLSDVFALLTNKIIEARQRARTSVEA